jgi:hypothetical protein
MSISNGFSVLLVKCGSRHPDILTVHNCYIKVVPAIEENRPGIGGDGQGPIPEQSLPLPTVTNQNPHYRIASSKEQESEEQESEVTATPPKAGTYS